MSDYEIISLVISGLSLIVSVFLVRNVYKIKNNLNISTTTIEENRENQQVISGDLHQNINGDGGANAGRDASVNNTFNK